MKFRPLHDRVVVKRAEPMTKTAGGIIVPDSVADKPQEGDAIATGTGTRDETGKIVPLDVQAGDRIVFSKWSGTEITVDGTEYLVMKESDIIGVLDKAA